MKASIFVCALALTACAHAGHPSPPPASRPTLHTADGEATPQAERSELDGSTTACIDMAHHIADLVCDKSIVDDRVSFTSDAERQIYKDDYVIALAKARIFDHFIYDLCVPHVTQALYDCSMTADTLMGVSECAHVAARAARKASR